ncbi:hypothetical protein ASG87_13485 [Frateuria sp. Soil773]|uniref:hypothetical protein n=1 Tax=Frateuria sp. Soil773 TaxID=1736407 RepID=UPI0006FDCFDE|nr:hypothetical protein [Frateuria sp. Soil773]KRE99994.1 hypothetical protein ASG87_13485 [Frateuria sp. Soil773]
MREPRLLHSPFPADDDKLDVLLRADYARYDFAVPLLPPEPLRVAPCPLDAGPPGLRPADPQAMRDYEARLRCLARRVAGALPVPDHPAWRSPPQTPVGRPALVQALDRHIRGLSQAGMPLDTDQALRMLAQPRMAGCIARSFLEARLRRTAAPARLRRLSEIRTLRMRLDASVAVDKCIYPRLPVALRDPARERAFLDWAQADPGVDAFCRIGGRHGLLRLRYQDDEGGPAAWRPDFLVRLATVPAVYLVELHGPRPGAARLHAAMGWCERINALPSILRDMRSWFYAPLGGVPLDHGRRRGARLGELLAFARLRAGYVAR